MTRSLFCIPAAVLIVVLSLADGNVYGQPTKNNSKILDLFKPVVAKSAPSVVSVMIDGKQVALGTVVDADGIILTKDSELKGDKITVKFKGGNELPAKKIATNIDWDLAVLKVEAKNLTAVSWSQSQVAPVGNWVATPGLSERPLAIGIVGVAARTMPAGPKIPLPTGVANRGYLGIMLAPEDNGGVRITSVVPKGAADKAGLKADDIILAVEGKETPNPLTLSATIGLHKPGETITLRFRRGDKEDELKAKLDERPSDIPFDRSDLQNSMGTSRSERRTGFPSALQHDTDLKASQCGGPLVDIEGRVIGINIARGGRTDTYAIPAEALLALLPDLIKGKTQVVLKPTVSLADKIKAAEAKLKEAETAKAVSEKEVAKAKEALEKFLAEQKKEKK